MFFFHFQRISHGKLFSRDLISALQTSTDVIENAEQMFLADKQFVSFHFVFTRGRNLYWYVCKQQCLSASLIQTVNKCRIK